MSRPIVTIIGRPNVGKSSLFNRFLRRRQAIVSPVAGTTRDRLYAAVSIDGLEFDLVDTAGLDQALEGETFGAEMLEQVQLAVEEADALIFMLDAQSGMTRDDQVLAEIIRKANTPTVVFLNKVDSPDQVVDDKLLHTGLGPTIKGSLIHRRGTTELVREIAQALKPNLEVSAEPVVQAADQDVIRIALVGRPNVGKSTLYNALIGDKRTIVSDIAGTTRDTIDTKITLSDGQSFVITDTAGLRRRGKIGRADKIEQYSVVRTLRAIDNADLVLLVTDAAEGLTRGDVHVAMYAQEQKKPLITVLNKADLVEPTHVNVRRFPFLNRQPMIFVSALDNVAIDQLINLIAESVSKLDDEPDQSTSEETPQSTPFQ